jgi:hypothetical protein
LARTMDFRVWFFFALVSVLLWVFYWYPLQPTCPACYETPAGSAALAVLAALLYTVERKGGLKHPIAKWLLYPNFPLLCVLAVFALVGRGTLIRMGTPISIEDLFVTCATAWILGSILVAWLVVQVWPGKSEED